MQRSKTSTTSGTVELLPVALVSELLLMHEASSGAKPTESAARLGGGTLTVLSFRPQQTSRATTSHCQFARSGQHRHTENNCQISFMGFVFQPKRRKLVGQICCIVPGSVTMPNGGEREIHLHHGPSCPYDVVTSGSHLHA